MPEHFRYRIVAPREAEGRLLLKLIRGGFLVFALPVLAAYVISRGGRILGIPSYVGVVLLFAVVHLFQRFKPKSPGEVQPVDGSATADEIRALLRNGNLLPDDLVDSGEGWQSLADHPAFEDDCAPIRAREGRWDWLNATLVFGLAIGSYLLFWLLP